MAYYGCNLVIHFMKVSGQLLSRNNWLWPSWCILFRISMKTNANILNDVTQMIFLDIIYFCGGVNLRFCPRWWFLVGYWLCVTNKLLSQGVNKQHSTHCYWETVWEISNSANNLFPICQNEIFFNQLLNKIYNRDDEDSQILAYMYVPWEGPVQIELGTLVDLILAKL